MGRHVDDGESDRRFPVQSSFFGAQFARALELSTDRLAAFGHLFREPARRSVGLTMVGQNLGKSLSLAELDVTKIPASASRVMRPQVSDARRTKCDN